MMCPVYVPDDLSGFGTPPSQIKHSAGYPATGGSKNSYTAPRVQPSAGTEASRTNDRVATVAHGKIELGGKRPITEAPNPQHRLQAPGRSGVSRRRDPPRSGTSPRPFPHPDPNLGRQVRVGCRVGRSGRGTGRATEDVRTPASGGACRLPGSVPRPGWCCRIGSIAEPRRGRRRR